jgi:hypothetical protein
LFKLSVSICRTQQYIFIFVCNGCLFVNSDKKVKNEDFTVFLALEKETWVHHIIIVNFHIHTLLIEHRYSNGFVGTESMDCVKLKTIGNNNTMLITSYCIGVWPCVAIQIKNYQKIFIQKYYRYRYIDSICKHRTYVEEVVISRHRTNKFIRTKRKRYLND